MFFANESDLQAFVSAIAAVQRHGATQGGNDNYYVDGNGVVHTLTEYGISGSIVVNAGIIVVNGQTPFIGNASFPFDPSHPTCVYLANQSSSQPEAIGYVDYNGVAYIFSAPIIGVWFNSTGSCIAQYWPNPAPTWCSYSDVFNSPQPADLTNWPNPDSTWLSGYPLS